LPGDERGPSGGAAWVRVVVGKQHALFGDAVDVRRVAHHAVGIGADIPHADIVAEDDEDVGLPVGKQGRAANRCQFRDELFASTER
jgi:hypothetical protein